MLLRVPKLLHSDFRFTRFKRNPQEILHRKNSRFVHLELERGLCFISYRQRKTSMLKSDAKHHRNVRSFMVGK